MKNKILLGCLVVILAMSGCAWFEPEKEKTAKELNDEGLEYLEDARYTKAIESFEKLRDWYPFSEYATTAELKIADTHYFIEEYEEAAFAYREFEELHPTNENTPYAVYQIGRCYFVQVDAIDRDQTSAQKALHSFERFIKNYPDSVDVPQAKENIIKCLQSITGQELYVGRYYYKTDRYKAALQRFHNVIKDYPDVGCHKEALEYILLCRKEIDREAKEKEADLLEVQAEDQKEGQEEDPEEDQEEK